MYRKSTDTKYSKCIQPELHPLNLNNADLNYAKRSGGMRSLGGGGGLTYSHPPPPIPHPGGPLFHTVGGSRSKQPTFTASTPQNNTPEGFELATPSFHRFLPILPFLFLNNVVFLSGFPQPPLPHLF